MCCHCLFFKITVEIVANWCLLFSTREIPSRVASFYHVIIYRNLVSKNRWPGNSEILELWTLRGRHGHLKYLSGNNNDGYLGNFLIRSFWVGFVLIWRNKSRNVRNFFCAKNIQFLLWMALCLSGLSKKNFRRATILQLPGVMKFIIWVDPSFVIITINLVCLICLIHAGE